MPALVAAIQAWRHAEFFFFLVCVVTHTATAFNLGVTKGWRNASSATHHGIRNLHRL